MRLSQISCFKILGNLPLGSSRTKNKSRLEEKCPHDFEKLPRTSCKFFFFFSLNRYLVHFTVTAFLKSCAKHSMFIKRIPFSASWGSSFCSGTLQGNPFNCHTLDIGPPALSRVGQGSYPRKNCFSAHTHPSAHTSTVCTHRHPHSRQNSPTMPFHTCCAHMRRHALACSLVSCQRSCTRGAEHQDLFSPGNSCCLSIRT